MPEEKPGSRELGRYLALAQAGIEMVAPAALGAVVDYLVGWGFWATVIGAVLGFVGGMIHLISMSNQIERAELEKKKKNRS